MQYDWLLGNLGSNTCLSPKWHATSYTFCPTGSLKNIHQNVYTFYWLLLGPQHVARTVSEDKRPMVRPVSAASHSKTCTCWSQHMVRTRQPGYELGSFPSTALTTQHTPKSISASTTMENMRAATEASFSLALVQAAVPKKASPPKKKKLKLRKQQQLKSKASASNRGRSFQIRPC